MSDNKIIPAAFTDHSYKYPWEYAPAWAEYAATDRDGAMYWYENRPVYDAFIGKFGGDGGRVEPVPAEAKTLRRRPR